MLSLALLLGVLNGVAAVGAFYAVYGARPDDVGWFAYAPLNETAALDWYGFPWEYVAVPAVLVVLNAAFLPLAVRRGWLQQ